MKKLAIFVEGLTELIFVEKLLLEIGNQRELSIRKEQLQGGKRCPATSSLISEIPETNETKYKILIYSSCNDEKVLSDIKERYLELKANGYSMIIGLRDLYPTDYSKRDRVKNAIQKELERSKLDYAHVILAVMEVETWFIAETTHYQRLHSRLTFDKINPIIDLQSTCDFEKEVKHPAQSLHKIYQLVNYAYKKKEKQVQRTIDKLDYAELYINLSKSISGLNEFISHIDAFFSE